MPFKNEHAARQKDPSQYSSFRRGSPKGFPAGVSVIWGLKQIGGKTKSEIQSIRFKADKWTADRARKWLKSHNFRTTLEVATKKSFWHDVIYGTIQKAKWTIAYINDLPDAAFAVILPGGKKDKDGKTVPRSLRVFPHHNENVKKSTENTTVDLSHLRNALARLKQAKISNSAKSKAKSHLEAHAKKLLPSYKDKEVKKNLWEGIL